MESILRHTPLQSADVMLNLTLRSTSPQQSQMQMLLTLCLFHAKGDLVYFSWEKEVPIQMSIKIISACPTFF